MHRLELLDDSINVVQGVLNLVISVRWWQLELEDETVQFVKNDHKW